MSALKTVLILSLFVISCQSTNKKDENQIMYFDIKELPIISEVKLSDLGFADIEYIPLETNEHSIISGTNDVFMPIKISVGERFYLIKHFNTILKFQNNGLFVTKIGTVGRGPNEFTVAHDANIEEKSQNIYLLARWQKKFFVYSERGELIKTLHIPFSPNGFSFLENGILCYSENSMGNIENSFVVIDTLGRIIKNFPNKFPFTLNKTGGVGVGRENLFYQFNNQLFKKEVYSDTVYVFENMGFKPHLVIEMGNRLLTPEARSQYDLFYLGENYIRPLRLFEFGEFVYYEFIYKIELPDNVLIYSYIGSKKSNYQALINGNQGIINDLDGGPNIFPRTIKDDNTIIALVDALKLKTHVASEAFKNSIPKYPERKKELEKLANSLKETDNPVLVLVSLKK